jgi:hypothetical protein
MGNSAQGQCIILWQSWVLIGHLASGHLWTGVKIIYVAAVVAVFCVGAAVLPYGLVVPLSSLCLQAGAS